MCRAAGRQVCRYHGMDRDEAQQPPPTCRLPHHATATGVGWLRSFRFSTSPARAPGVSAPRPRSSVMRTLVSRFVFHMTGARRALDLLVDVGRYGPRCWQCGRTCARTGIGDGRHDALERFSPTHFCCFTWINGVDLRYGSTADQGRTGRKDSSSQLWRSARAPGTHAKQGPSTGHSAVGLRQAEKCLLTPRPHFTAPSCSLVTRWFVLRTALLFVRGAVRFAYADLSEPVTICSPKHALGELGACPRESPVCRVADDDRQAGSPDAEWHAGTSPKRPFVHHQARHSCPERSR